MQCNMNDAGYPGYYSVIGNQLLPPHHPHPPAAELLSLSTPIHALEPDTNFTNFFDDDQSALSSSVAAAATATGVAVGVSAAAAVPFVQIHTTDLQLETQVGKSYRNFRRKTAEIKSEAELIKSEQATDAAAKERLNATPTPPTRNTSCPSVEGKSTVVVGDGSTSDNRVLHRCHSCPYLTLCPMKMQSHMANCFGEQPSKQCPGCQNIFVSQDVLLMHLSLDHHLEEHEISALLKKSSVREQTKSRIFIKNVACLQEPPPPPPPPPQEQNSLPDFLPLMPHNENAGAGSNIMDLLDDVTEQVTAPSKPSQKISIKSVDVLREPALLPFDFQLPQTEPAILTDNNLLDVQVVGVEPEKPRQPKIYIRNVDILKEPMVLPSALPGMGFNGTGVTGTTTPGTNGGVAGDVFHTDALLTPTGPLPGFEPSLAPLANMCNEAFAFDAVLGCNGGVTGTAAGMDTSRFSALDLDFAVDFDHGVAPLVTEATPPPSSVIPPPPPHPITLEPPPVELGNFIPPAPNSTNTQSKQKIFIKNVDILKAPQRGTLHLRTVDELNLMNRNEVEHLMVPLMELPIDQQQQQQPHHHHHHQQPQQHHHHHQQQQHQQQHQQHSQQQQTIQEPSVAGQTLSDFQPSLSNSWPSEEGYDLAEDLDCWRWMEEPLQGASGQSHEEAPASTQLDPSTEDLLVKDFAQLYNGAPNPPPPPPSSSVQLPTVTLDQLSCGVGGVGVGIGDGGGGVPPLVPVTASGGTMMTSSSSNLSSLPVPPLVPLASEATVSITAEKPARIYVANNLLPAAVEPPSGGTSVRGRPYGAKQAGGNLAKRRPPPGAQQIPEGGKCQVEGCMFRFKSPSTLEYHGRCHNGALGSAQPMICPECQSSEFSNWNCLHTHLWRTHQIDMELYCCQLCSFKTPIYSRLVNTHAKIHSEERNYKCEQCGKGFKNTKQLKNHRRLHRTQGLGMGKPPTAAPPPPPIMSPNNPQEKALTALLHRCEDCGAAFKQRKTLREHLCKERNEQPQCQTCQRLFSSKSSLKLHMRSHQSIKRFKCESCEYEASDHNAFRRHLGTHKERKRYACPHCDFRAIQSTAFRLHLQKRHPEKELSSIIHKCDVCSFSSINQGLLLVHQAKHEANQQSSNPTTINNRKSVPGHISSAVAAIPSQIKVESSLLLAHSSTNAKEQSADAIGGLTLMDPLPTS